MHFNFQETIVETQVSGRLVVAAFLGVLIGIERSLTGKHAGMRTYGLVALGSALFCLVGTFASYQLAYFSGVNPLQIAGSVAIGIGFIGSGVAMFRGEHPGELTTASGIWVVAAVGMACGFGFYTFAFIAALLSIAMFVVVSKIEHSLRARWGGNTE
jgi:putative Mg2+ transporter-C (MgtC) family protein